MCPALKRGNLVGHILLGISLLNLDQMIESKGRFPMCKNGASVLTFSALLITVMLALAASSGPTAALTTKQCYANHKSCENACIDRVIASGRGAYEKCRRGCAGNATSCLSTASDKPKLRSTKTVAEKPRSLPSGIGPNTQKKASERRVLQTNPSTTPATSTSAPRAIRSVR